MEKDNETKDTFAMEVLEQSKRNTIMWFIISILSMAALIGTNAYWIHTFNSYEYVYQNGEGQNNYNNNVEGDVDNVTAD